MMDIFALSCHYFRFNAFSIKTYHSPFIVVLSVVVLLGAAVVVVSVVVVLGAVIVDLVVAESKKYMFTSRSTRRCPGKSNIACLIYRKTMVL
jgi:hypothetical protein